jgi:ribosome recycling factor
MADGSFDLKDLEKRMRGAVSVLKQEFGGLRTGRASASLLDPIMVNAYGSKMPLNQLATVSVPEARMISVSVWDKSLVTATDKAIRESDLATMAGAKREPSSLVQITTSTGRRV